jgi:thioredoxin:protein disulfide reductase
MRPKLIIALWIALCLAALCPAQDTEGFRFTVRPEKLILSPAAKGRLVLVAESQPGYYLYRDMFSVQVEAPKEIAFSGPAYPPSHAKYDPNTEMEKQVYDGTVEIPLNYAVSASAPSDGRIVVRVSFQGCSPVLCYLPQTQELAVPFTVKGGAPAAPAGRDAAVAEPASPLPTEPPAPGEPFAAPTVTPPAPAAPAPAVPSPAPAAASQGDFGSLVQSSYFLAFLFVFLFGIGTSFTPCVYPIIPITISVFGARGAESRLKGFLLSLTYVQGICLVYSTLGVASAFSGAIFGQFMSNPWVIGAIVAVFLLLGLFMAGVFQFNLPSSLQTKASQVGGKGFLGAFTMGMVAGVIAAPCTGPALAGVLTYVATTKSLLLGFLLLYTYSLGFGLLFIVLGTFSALIRKLPKSGEWMEVVKGVFAVVMFAAAWYFLKNVLPALNLEMLSRQTLIVAGPLLLVIGWMSGGLRLDFHGAPPARVIRKAVTLAILTAGLIFTLLGIIRPGPLTAESGAAHAGQPAWSYDLEGTLDQARQEGKPVIVDFYADWCAACIELDKFTYADPAVLRELERFRVVKVDMTRPLPRDARLKSTYGIVGLPVVAFYDRQGRLLANPRVTGFLEAKQFLALLRQVQ